MDPRQRYSGMTEAQISPYSLVAQLVEQATVNRFVAGSSPARGAKLKRPGPSDLAFLVSADPELDSK